VLRISWRWRPLYDDNVKQTFVVSPLFGSLHAISFSRSRVEDLPKWASLLGCTEHTFSKSGWLAESVVPPAASHTWYSSNTEQAQWIGRIRRELNRLPLILVVDRIEKGSSVLNRADALHGEQTHSRRACSDRTCGMDVFPRTRVPPSCPFQIRMVEGKVGSSKPGHRRARAY
jgi:hypothetical protein